MRWSNMNNIALGYAQSLFELALEEHQLVAYMESLSFVDKSLDEEIISFFHHPLIHMEEKNELMDRCFRELVHPYVLNFLKLLHQKQRFNLIKVIIKEFALLNDEYHGIKKGVLYTASPLTDEEIERIQTAVSKKEKATIQLEVKIDESLLGGIKVTIGDHVIDSSIKNRLSLLRKDLLKGKVGE